jgi:hypothetical protein
MNLNFSNPTLIVLAVAAVLLIVVAVALDIRRRRDNTAKLRQRYGPEYERAVSLTGSERKAEASLANRETRVEKLKIRELDATERARYLTQWQMTQARFVDYPKGAVREADELVCSLMQTRGYPVSDFEQRAADISVDHPRVVENYRSAHGIAMRQVSGEVNTEDLRIAMVHYHSLFDDLLLSQSSGIQRVA